MCDAFIFLAAASKASSCCFLYLPSLVHSMCSKLTVAVRRGVPAHHMEETRPQFQQLVSRGHFECQFARPCCGNKKFVHRSFFFWVAQYKYTTLSNPWSNHKIVTIFRILQGRFVFINNICNCRTWELCRPSSAAGVHAQRNTSFRLNILA